jgi:hypothetical protein
MHDTLVSAMKLGTLLGSSSLKKRCLYLFNVELILLDHALHGNLTDLLLDSLECIICLSFLFGTTSLLC